MEFNVSFSIKMTIIDQNDYTTTKQIGNKFEYLAEIHFGY